MVLTTVLLAALAAAPPQPACTLPDGFHVNLEVAASDQERQLGLMFRDNLPPNDGMIFLFEQDDKWPFWMKNTFIPLDLIWLDPQGKVVDLRPTVQPCHRDPCPSYAPGAAARAVLELNGGAAAKHDLRVGSTLRFEDVPGYPVRQGPSR